MATGNPLFASDQPNHPARLRRALATIDTVTDDYLAAAGLLTTA